MTVSGAHVEVGAHRVWVEEHGRGDPVLLVNGLGCDTTTWALQLGALAAGYRTIAFDLPGVGRTEGPLEGLSIPRFADVAAGLLEALEAPPAHVVGVSLGGAVALELALRRPERVRSLSLHSSWARTDRYLAELFRSWIAARQALELADFLRLVRLWTFTIGYVNDRADELAELDRIALTSPYLQSAEGYAAQAAACVEHDVLDRLGAIRAPTYLSAGDRDLVTPPHHHYALKEGIPGSRLRLWKAMGHVPHWEIPEEFNRRQLEFLASV